MIAATTPTAAINGRSGTTSEEISHPRGDRFSWIDTRPGLVATGRNWRSSKQPPKRCATATLKGTSAFSGRGRTAPPLADPSAEAGIESFDGQVRYLARYRAYPTARAVSSSAPRAMISSVPTSWATTSAWAPSPGSPTARRRGNSSASLAHAAHRNLAAVLWTADRHLMATHPSTEAFPRDQQSLWIKMWRDPRRRLRARAVPDPETNRPSLDQPFFHQLNQRVDDTNPSRPTVRGAHWPARRSIRIPCASMSSRRFFTPNKQPVMVRTTCRMLHACPATRADPPVVRGAFRSCARGYPTVQASGLGDRETPTRKRSEQADESMCRRGTFGTCTRPAKA
jgi:hypothetical protein